MVAAVVAPLLQLKVPLPFAVKVDGEPLQTVSVAGVILTDAEGFTLTVVEAVAVQFELLVTVTVYVALFDGDTLMVADVLELFHA